MNIFHVKTNESSAVWTRREHGVCQCVKMANNIPESLWAVHVKEHTFYTVVSVGHNPIIRTYTDCNNSYHSVSATVTRLPLQEVMGLHNHINVIISRHNHK